MNLFMFSLTGKALDWILQLTLNSLTTWDQVTVAFLSKFIPLEKMTKLRSNIANFKEEPDESLYDAWRD
ncbi:Adenine phosphoribosyltransferase [Bienertia sinuspersici]